ncbi:MAG: pdxA [Solimicrobium sp.]|jgi:4-hydroxythreonine-4-phosphate dehydrogenase|nr:pdxA [Solimicrobium sp.]
MKPNSIAITIGEPAGIGPEISLRAAWEKRHECWPVLIGDADLLRDLARRIDLPVEFNAITDFSQLSPLLSQPKYFLTVLHVPLSCSVIAGRLDARNGLSTLATLDIAIAGAMQGKFDAIVTAPLQKSTINDAGVSFSGHTEYLAEKTQTKKVVMMLACQNPYLQNPTPGRPLRVALATTHLPLRAVPAAITFDTLSQILTILHNDLKNKFGIQHPVILVTGLNPHAGENGYLGREEIEIIRPAILAAQACQIDARGPFPADTLFQEKYLHQADCILAMYHDQGLPVLKYASFGRGVNVTLGLPIIRTSVDHGTALDIAARGVGIADIGSMLAAIDVSCQMARSSY